MSGFRWIQMSLFLMLLHLTAITGQIFSYTVRDGDEVTLLCENVIEDQDKCGRTTWLFSYLTKETAKELVSFGQISKPKAGRLRVTANCSLVVKKATADDVGLYTCRRFRSGKHADTDVYLSVINMNEFKDTDEVTLSCSVSTYKGCGHAVKWLYKGKDVAKDSKDMNTSRSECSATVSFSTSHFIYISKYHELFKCYMTDGYTGKVQLFPFSAQSSGEKPGEDAATRSISTAAPTTKRSISTAAPTTKRSISTAAPTTTPTTSTTQEARTDCSALNYIMLVMRVAELVLITVITVLLIRARGNQRPPDDDTLHQDGDGHDGTVNYENVGDASASVRLH